MAQAAQPGMPGIQGPPGGPGPQPPVGQPPAGPPPAPQLPASAPFPLAPVGPFIPPTREIWLNAPPVFDRNRKNDNFLQAVLLYTGLNSHIFNSDRLKIGFTLSFLTDKEAAQWREAWVWRNQTAGTINYPTWAVFKAELSGVFQPIDQVGDVMHS